jgi:hypothetical protein
MPLPPLMQGGRLMPLQLLMQGGRLRMPLPPPKLAASLNMRQLRLSHDYIL